VTSITKQKVDGENWEQWMELEQQKPDNILQKSKEK
jgi:hypothetical protein